MNGLLEPVAETFWGSHCWTAAVAKAQRLEAVGLGEGFIPPGLNGSPTGGITVGSSRAAFRTFPFAAAILDNHTGAYIHP